eukprot:1658929-Heterocapsa_arctica.AAC.1
MDPCGSPWTSGGGASALGGRGRQGQGGSERLHALDPCVSPWTSGGGASARGGRGRQGQGDNV